MTEPTAEEIRRTLSHWRDETLEKNLRELQSEILKLKLGKGSVAMIQNLQQEYDKRKSELVKSK
ncbi:MAG TPA: hypothetical protein EYF95_04730 [Flavobacteriales bacterium]|nr:hypothetical protein [Flavobacteriales bacterium]HIK67253.1 hypothetical protein [Flavobacteriales bacterium]